MVAVLHAAPEATAPQALAAWLQSVGAALPPPDRVAIDDALAFARELYGETRTADGERLLDRSLGTASIMAGLNFDVDSLRAAILLGSARACASQPMPTEQRRQAERLRKMLLAMVEDIRVVLIKLAERTQALRFLMSADDDEPQRAAREVLELFAPLANRLGVWQLKWELEDLSLRALEPEVYKSIAQLLDERRHDREAYIRKVMAMLAQELAAAGIKAEVSGRPKHIYSIYNKMQRKGSGIDALYDIRAVRILVDEVKDCYTALGFVHNLWTPMPKEFDDYIARPKANDYRSLHTAVIGPEGKPLEVQIRTHEMHRHSEYGVAAHWRYKEGRAVRARRSRLFDDKIAWLRQVLDWKEEVAGPGEWLEQFKTSLFEDTIYVLTPQGKVIDLPKGRRRSTSPIRCTPTWVIAAAARKVERRDGAAEHAVAERPAGRGHHRQGRAGRRATG